MNENNGFLLGNDIEADENTIENSQDGIFSSAGLDNYSNDSAHLLPTLDYSGVENLEYKNMVDLCTSNFDLTTLYHSDDISHSDTNSSYLSALSSPNSTNTSLQGEYGDSYESEVFALNHSTSSSSRSFKEYHSQNQNFTMGTNQIGVSNPTASESSTSVQHQENFQVMDRQLSHGMSMESLAPDVASMEHTGDHTCESPSRFTRSQAQSFSTAQSKRLRSSTNARAVGRSNTASAKTRKPDKSYVELVARALLSSAENRMLISDIYEFLMKNFPCFSTENEKSWRNSVRHNLCMMKCFKKLNQSQNGRGHYWAIEEEFLDAFKNGDFSVAGCKDRKPITSHNKSKKFKALQSALNPPNISYSPPGPYMYGNPNSSIVQAMRSSSIPPETVYADRMHQLPHWTIIQTEPPFHPNLMQQRAGVAPENHIIQQYPGTPQNPFIQQYPGTPQNPFIQSYPGTPQRVSIQNNHETQNSSFINQNMDMSHNTFSHQNASTPYSSNVHHNPKTYRSTSLVQLQPTSNITFYHSQNGFQWPL